MAQAEDRFIVVETAEGWYVANRATGVEIRRPEFRGFYGWYWAQQSAYRLNEKMIENSSEKPLDRDSDGV